MSIEITPTVLAALSAFVITLDRHPISAAALVAVLLAAGLAVTLAKQRKP